MDELGQYQASLVKLAGQHTRGIITADEMWSATIELTHRFMVDSAAPRHRDDMTCLRKCGVCEHR